MNKKDQKIIQEEKKQNNQPKKQQEQDIETLAQDLQNMTDTAKRALADLQNFKRHAEEQRSTLMNMGQIDIITKLMPIYDNLNLAISHTPEELKDNEWSKGIQNIKTQFLKLLEDAGLKLLDGKGQQANPNHHEIITAVPGAPQNEIIEVLEQGYTFNNKLIKPSKVVVGNE